MRKQVRKKKKYKIMIKVNYFSTDEITVFVAEDFLVVLEDTVARTGTHEVIVALAGGKAAAHCRPSLVTSFTTL